MIDVEAHLQLGERSLGKLNSSHVVGRRLDGDDSTLLGAAPIVRVGKLARASPATRRTGPSKLISAVV